jgi:hypothetical protein
MDLITIEPVAAPPVPQVLTKSMVAAMGCEHHFAAYYLSDNALLRRLSSPLAETGTQFHAYRAAYVDHLITEQRSSDAEWGAAWIARHSPSEDAQGLIDRDLLTFEINPDQVMGIELFLSIDRQFQPLERSEGGTPGHRSTHPRAYLSGTLDLLLIDGSMARILDPKSGWSTSAVNDHEPQQYAVLVFAHFPQVEIVEFVWEFARLRADKRATFTREDLPELHATMVRAHAQMQEIARRAAEGEQLRINPFAGRCSYCEITCPIREQVTRGVIDLPPIQSPADAREVAARIVVGDMWMAGARSRLRDYLGEFGPLDIGDWVAQNRVEEKTEYPLPAVLDLLGVATTNGEPLYQVDLNTLRVGSTKLNALAKTKKRAGLREKLDRIKRVSYLTKLQIRRSGVEPEEE